MKMKFLMICILITTVNGRNSRNVEFNELPEEKLLDAVCRSFRKPSTPSHLCDLNTCNVKNGSLDLTKYNLMNESTLALPKLICKEDNMANFFLGPSEDFAYFFEVEIADENSTNFTSVTTCDHYTITELNSDTDYSIRVWAASHSKKQIIHSVAMNLTILNKYKDPSPVTNITVQNITCEKSSCEAIIEWSPNEDYSCQYDLVWVGKDLKDDSINVISGLHRAVLKDLEFDTKYKVQIVARNQGSFHESEKEFLNFLTPSCLEIFHSLDKCRPEAPKRLIVDETVVDSSSETLIYNVHLTWDKPDLLPTYYIVRFSNLVNDNTTRRELNITGNQTTAILRNVKLDEFYHVSLTACSPVNCSATVVEERHRTENVAIDVSSHHKWRLLTLILVPLIAVMMGTLIINYYRGKQKRRDERERYFTGLDEEKLPESSDIVEINLIKQNISDQWELNPNKLYFQSVIGEGAFGVVRMAYLETQDNSKIPVAVKMLKESPTSDEIRQFTQEINIMKSVGQHPYIVSLIGCITQGRIEGPLLVVEYCSRGDLQSYLRIAWEKCCTIHQEVFNSDETTNNQRNYFANRIYDFHDVNSDDEFIIQPKHLLSIARQVALGMEHLAQTRVVHRDLAARNVLVCDNHTVKVSDFGLSRDIYRDNVYCKSSGGKLPIRWMALESLTHQRYTTHSDVWSFGVLLWEIVTLGGTPYVGIHASDLLEFLKIGNRLSRPSNCSPELYDIMQSCWRTSPKNRPTFTDLCKSLETLLEDVSHYLQLENYEVPLNCDNTKLSSNKSSQSIPSSEHYLRTINSVT